MKRWIAGFLFLFKVTVSVSQIVQSNFSVPVQACLNQNIEPVNLSTNATRYEWDFCQGDLALTSSASLAVNLGGNVTTGVDVVFDGAGWYGFIANQNSNSILKLSFGADITSTPTITNLGNINGVINSPTDIKVVVDNGNWYGFVYGLNSPMISRIDFGSSLSNPAPTATAILSGSGSTNGGFDMIREGTGWMIVLSYFNSAKLVRLTSVTAIPTISDIIDTTPFGSTLGDVVLVKSNASYFAYAVDFGNRNLYRMDFGSSVFNIPVVTNLNVSVLSGVTPFGIDVGQDNLNYYALISTIEGNLVRINLGENLSSDLPTGVSLGNLGALENTLKIKLLKHQSRWFAFTTSWSSTRLYRVNFGEPVCEISPAISTLPQPLVDYSSSGSKAITLRAFAASGEYSEITQPIFITTFQAPELTINFSNYCIASPTDFTVSSSLPLTAYNWDFGDASTSASPAPLHQYASVGEYDVRLTATATNGCDNSSTTSLEIFNIPVANFSLPAPAVTCTFHEYFFDNTSLADAGANVSWQWQIDNVNQSVAEDALLSFSSVDNHEVKLIASIPGCSSEISKTFTVSETGPNVDFNSSGFCQGSSIVFTNATTGPVNNFSWDFDDGQNSTDVNPIHIFSNPGLYDVLLTATNVAGCNNTKLKQVVVYTKPQVNFASSLPPFSCNGSPTLFNDLTPNPMDSNIDSWDWNFGDSGSGQNTSTLKDPQHTYALAGTYTVSLTVSTNFLCSSTLQLPVVISQSPVADFTFTAPCEDVPVNFTDTSTGTIQSWEWQIGSTFYFTQNPTHTFNNPVSTSAILTVEASNDCIASVSKPIIVPSILIPDFSVSRNCTGQQTLFTDITNASADPVSTYNWDFAGLGSASTSPATFTFSTTGSKSVTLTITTQTGCTYPNTKLVNITPPPQANFIASPDVGAPPLAVQFTNSSVGATSYLWSFNDSGETTSTEVSPNFAYQELGQYLVELTASDVQNCFHTFSRTINVLTPVIDAALNGLELMEFQNGSIRPAVTIFNNGNTPLINLGLLLDISGAVIREYVGVTILPNTSYRHVLQFELPNTQGLEYLCIEADVDDITPADNKTCLNLEKMFTSFSPYPNPANDEVHVDWIMNEDGIVNISFINMMGQEVKNLQLNSSEGFNGFIVETEDIDSGVYLICIKYKTFTRIYRVIISE